MKESLVACRGQTNFISELGPVASFLLTLDCSDSLSGLFFPLPKGMVSMW